MAAKTPVTVIKGTEVQFETRPGIVSKEGIPQPPSDEPSEAAKAAADWTIPRLGRSLARDAVPVEFSYSE